jgi:hypothetical protein
MSVVPLLVIFNAEKKDSVFSKKRSIANKSVKAKEKKKESGY